MRKISRILFRLVAIGLLTGCAGMGAVMSTSDDPATRALGTLMYVEGSHEQRIKESRAGKSEVNVNVPHQSASVQTNKSFMSVENRRESQKFYHESLNKKTLSLLDTKFMIDITDRISNLRDLNTQGGDIGVIASLLLLRLDFNKANNKYIKGIKETRLETKGYKVSSELYEAESALESIIYDINKMHSNNPDIQEIIERFEKAISFCADGLRIYSQGYHILEKEYRGEFERGFAKIKIGDGYFLQGIQLLQQLLEEYKYQINKYEMDSLSEEINYYSIKHELVEVKTDVLDVYKAGYKSYKEGSTVEAREYFISVLGDYPENDYSDNARFWIGESYFKEGMYEDAILAYEEVLRKNPDSDKVPGALLKQALAFYAIKDNKTGRIILEKLINIFPSSEQAVLAKRKLRGY